MNIHFFIRSTLQTEINYRINSLTYSNFEMIAPSRDVCLVCTNILYRNVIYSAVIRNVLNIYFIDIYLI